MFPAVAKAEYGSKFLLTLINRSRADGATGIAFFQREMYLEAMTVAVEGASLGKSLVGQAP